MIDKAFQLQEMIQDLKAILHHGGSHPMTEEERVQIEKDIEHCQKLLAVELENRKTNPWAWS